MFDLATILHDSPRLDRFSQNLLAWFQQHGRHDLPWQVKNDPYKVWVSEIMLQQTQVKIVLNYYPRFIERFPSVHDLAAAEWDDVAPYWAGLGYYARARNLHKAAKQVAELGDFPQNLEAWQSLAGIGRSTAGALMSLGLGKFGVILDGNVKRVLARYFAIENDFSKKSAEQQLWQLAERLVPTQHHADYTQAIMDLGATICTPKKPLCLYCPMRADCQAYHQDRVLDFPVKKAKKSVPSKIAHVALFYEKNQQLSFWQQREANGLWGGLWSLPIFEDATAWQDFIQQQQLLSENTWQLTHHFTHFTWHLQVHIFAINSEQINALQQALQQFQPPHANAQWLSAPQLSTLAMPTAMQKICKYVKMI